MPTRCAAALAVLVCLSGCSDAPLTPSRQPAVEEPATIADLSGPSAVLVGAGDIGRCGSEGPEKTARLLDLIAGTVFAAGDIAYPWGRAEDFRNCFAPSWGRHLHRIRPAPGNHEYDTGTAQAYFEYFGAQAGPHGRGFYSYTLGSWLVLSLNSEVDFGAGGAQDQWLRARLTEHPTRCAAAYFHKPRFSSGRHGSNADMRDLWATLHAFGVEIVISAHDHLYERFAPQDALGRYHPRGVRQFVVGTGGAPLYEMRQLQSNSEALGDDWGVLKLTLFATSYQWEFVPVDGASYRDFGSAPCH
jgi:acid phosphatase type 7